MYSNSQQNSPSGASYDSSHDPSPDLVSRVTVSITGALTSGSPLLHRDACHKADIFNAALNRLMDYMAVKSTKDVF